MAGKYPSKIRKHEVVIEKSKLLDSMPDTSLEKYDHVPVTKEDRELSPSISHFLSTAYLPGNLGI